MPALTCRYGPVAILVVLLIPACTGISVRPPSRGHLRAVTPSPRRVERTARPIKASPKPQPPVAKPQTYSVAVDKVRAEELLFALARDAKLNVDIDPGISGFVTLNAVRQTLPQLLRRIARQVDIRWELDGDELAVMPDVPYLRNYHVDYINMSRDARASVSISTQIGATSATSAAGVTSGIGGNVSTTKIDATARNRFWDSLIANLRAILRETDAAPLREPDPPTARKRASRGKSRTNNARRGSTVTHPAPPKASAVIANPEGNVIAVRATARQHTKVREFLRQIMASARRQVLIEATIAEVRLSDGYQQGINWQSLRSLRGPAATAGLSIGQNPSGLDATGGVPDPFATSATGLLLNYVAPGLGISSTLSLLKNFGEVRVLSSPKISVLNNQTALLKVVNNVVYFEIQATTSQTTSTSLTTVSTTPRSVSVGLVMTVTPQISADGSVLLNVRPSISRINGYKSDPNPNIPAGLTNLVPEIETREMESLLRLNDGQIAVMGGLMQDSTDNSSDEVPGLASIPIIGNFFKQRHDTRAKTELVVFLRPTIIQDTSAAFRDERQPRWQRPNAHDGALR